MILVEFVQRLENRRAHGLRNIVARGDFAKLGNDAALAGHVEHAHRAKPNFVVSMILNRIGNRLGFFCACQQREQREGFKRLSPIFARQSIHGLRYDPRGHARLCYPVQHVSVSRFHHPDVSLRAIEVQTGQSAGGGGTHDSRFVAEGNQDRSKYFKT